MMIFENALVVIEGCELGMSLSLIEIVVSRMVNIVGGS